MHNPKQERGDSPEIGEEPSPLDTSMGLTRFTGTVPPHDYEFEASRSQGPGGQNVNKRATKAEIRFQVGSARCLSEGERARVRAWCKEHRPSLFLEGQDTILITDSTSRQQGTNRENAVRKLEQIIATALRPEKKRIPTKKPRSADERRLRDKRRRASKLSARRSSDGE